MLKWLHTYHFYPKTLSSLLLGLRAIFKSAWSNHCASELNTHTEEIRPPCQKCIFPGVTLVSHQFCSWSWHPANALDMNHHIQFKPTAPCWSGLPTAHTAPTTCCSAPDFTFAHWINDYCSVIQHQMDKHFKFLPLKFLQSSFKMEESGNLCSHCKVLSDDFVFLLLIVKFVPYFCRTLSEARPLTAELFNCRNIRQCHCYSAYLHFSEVTHYYSLNV